MILLKDIPGIIWILGIFIVSSVVLTLYAKMAPDMLPPQTNIWEQVQGFQENIEYRRMTLKPSEIRNFESPPYHFMASRMPDLEIPVPSRVYMLQIRPYDRKPLPDLWIGAGVDLAFVDIKPKELVGDVRLVKLRKLEKLE